MKEQNLNYIVKIIDSFGLIAIGMTSICYIVFSNRFAEYLVQFSFLDFPVFVGEIIMFLCLLLFFLKFKLAKIKLNKWHYILMIYFTFVVAKALYGYAQWGPLAFRDAALMYYPVFAVFCYFFYRRDFFFENRNALFISLLLIILYIKFFDQSYAAYWALSISILALMLTQWCSHRKCKYVLVLLVLMCMPYKLFFLTSRMMLVSNIVTEVYLVTIYVIVSNQKRSIKLSGVLLSLVFILTGLTTFSDSVRAKSIISFHNTIKRFQAFDERVQKEIGSFRMSKSEKINLYQPENEQGNFKNPFLEYKKSREVQQAKLRQFAKPEPTENLRIQPSSHNNLAPLDNNGPVSAKSQNQVVVDNVEISENLDNTQQLPLVSKLGYHMDTGLNNAVFRLFIWRDMIVELRTKKPIVGFDFGKPLRSVSLEILYWGWNAWGVDGWVAAHNSYLDIIYRTGLVGIALIASIFIILFQMIKGFAHNKSITGILLCAFIIDWFIAANFLLIFELPYTAIPIWSVYGITLAYFHEQKKLKYELEK